MMLTDQDIYLFREGTHVRAYEKLGAHPLSREGEQELQDALHGGSPA